MWSENLGIGWWRLLDLYGLVVKWGTDGPVWTRSWIERRPTSISRSGTTSRPTGRGLRIIRRFLTLPSIVRACLALRPQLPALKIKKLSPKKLPKTFWGWCFKLILCRLVPCTNFICKVTKQVEFEDNSKKERGLCFHQWKKDRKNWLLMDLYKRAYSNSYFLPCNG